MKCRALRPSFNASLPVPATIQSSWRIHQIEERTMPHPLVLRSPLVALIALSSISLAGDDKALKPGQEPARSKQLFDGTELSQWVIEGTKDQADWKLEDGAMVATRHDIASSAKFKSFVLHMEFNEPKLGPEFKGQDRGNSGMYLQGRYELQVLDSYHNETYPKGVCGDLQLCRSGQEHGQAAGRVADVRHHLPRRPISGWQEGEERPHHRLLEWRTGSGQRRDPRKPPAAPRKPTRPARSTSSSTTTP